MSEKRLYVLLYVFVHSIPIGRVRNVFSVRFRFEAESVALVVVGGGGGAVVIVVVVVLRLWFQKNYVHRGIVSC